MNKVFNINLAGRLIAIEESAYEYLQNYMAKLEKGFQHYEEADEIILDIKDRISELFTHVLKQGKVAISLADVKEVEQVIGLPEQIAEEADMEVEEDKSTSNFTASKEGKEETREKKKLYRSSSEQIFGGVAGGIAAYFNIDPVLVRVLFVLFSWVSGIGLLSYIILWIALPVNEKDNLRLTKRLYRDPEHKIIAGVCAGIAKYFDFPIIWARLIALSPIILSIAFLGIFNNGLAALGISLPSFVLIYIILWIAVPKASTKMQFKEMETKPEDMDRFMQAVSQEEGSVAIGVEDENIATDRKNRTFKGLILVIFGILLIAFVTIIFAMSMAHFGLNFGSTGGFFKSGVSSIFLDDGFGFMNFSALGAILIAFFALSVIFIPIYFFMYLLAFLINRDRQTNKSLKIFNIVALIWFIIALFGLIVLLIMGVM